MLKPRQRLGRLSPLRILFHSANILEDMSSADKPWLSFWSPSSHVGSEQFKAGRRGHFGVTDMKVPARCFSVTFLCTPEWLRR